MLQNKRLYLRKQTSTDNIHKLLVVKVLVNDDKSTAFNVKRCVKNCSRSSSHLKKAYRLYIDLEKYSRQLINKCQQSTYCKISWLYNNERRCLLKSFRSNERRMKARLFPISVLISVILHMELWNIWEKMLQVKF